MRRVWVPLALSALSLAGCIDWGAAYDAGCQARGWCGPDDSGSQGSSDGGADGGVDAGPIDAGRSNVLVADLGNHRLVSLESISGAGWRGLPAKAQALAGPMKLSFDNSGRLYVADYGNVRILRMDDFTGAGQATFGTYGDLNAYQNTAIAPPRVPPVGMFSGPVSVWVNPFDETVYVVDNHWLGGLGTGTAPGQLYAGAWYVQSFTWTGPTPASWRAFTEEGQAAFLDVFGPNANPTPGFYLSVVTNAVSCCSPTFYLQRFDPIPTTNTAGNRADSINRQENLWSNDGDAGSGWMLSAAVDTSTGVPVLYGGYLRGVAVSSIVGGVASVAGANDLTAFQDALSGVANDAGPEYGQLLTAADQALSFPYGLSVDNDPATAESGFLYIADTGNNRVVRTTKNLQGHATLALGSLGEGINQFRAPFDIKLGPDGRIYIVDTGNNRIVRVDDLHGTNWTVFGSTAGGGAGQFNSPQGVAYGPDGKIYVADSANARLVRMDDPSGAGWTEFAPAIGAKRLVNPTQVRVTSRGIWILDTGKAPPQVDYMSDMDGGAWATWVPPAFDLADPQGMTVDSAGRVFIADTKAGRIVEVDDFNGTQMTGTAVYVARGAAASANHFVNPTGIALDPTERFLYVTDPGSNQLIRLAHPDGGAELSVDTSWVSFTMPGSFPATFNRPSGVAVGSDGKIWVADTYNHRLVRMDDISGANLVIYGNDGSGKGQFVRPTGIAVK